MSEWQDISTAPRDGTPFIGYWGKSSELHGLMLMCQFNFKADAFVSRAGYDGDISKIIVIDLVDPPTEWAPLPSPPTRGRQ